MAGSAARDDSCFPCIFVLVLFGTNVQQHYGQCCFAPLVLTQSECACTTDASAFWVFIVPSGAGNYYLGESFLLTRGYSRAQTM